MNPTMIMTVDRERTMETTASRLSAKFRAKSPNAPGDASMRMMVYSHDTMGIGHMRRNLLIASHLQAEFENTTVLAITGAIEACAFSSSSGVDCLALPAFAKNQDGTYSARNLAVSTQSVLNIRQQTILAAVQSFQPDVLLVDKVPAGAGGELLPTLEWLRSGTSCELILGLREILDSPEVVRMEWQRGGLYDIVRKYFDAIWIYGDPNVYDALERYEFPQDLRKIARYTGYLRSAAPCTQLNCANGDAHVLCTVGGGQDGASVVEHFLEGAGRWTQPTVVLAGPHFPDRHRDRLKRVADRMHHVRWVDHSTDGDRWIRDASRVVAMGGYNTVGEIMAYRKPALIIPRTSPRQEQWLRASRLAEFGWVDMLHPNDLSANAISDWVRRDDLHLRNRIPLDFGGLARITEYLSDRFPRLQKRQLHGAPNAPDSQ